MLAYAAQDPSAPRNGSPKALALIVAAHALAIGAVMSARMEVGPDIPFDPTTIFDVPIETPPPPPEPETRPTTQRPESAQQSFIEKPTTIVDMDAKLSPDDFSTGATIEDIATVIGTDLGFDRVEPPVPVRVAARFNTPQNALKPPYPNDKLRDEEEAVLRLRLSIDPRGRVNAVEPVGAADPSFLEAARRHIIRSWRYKPATEDGVAVPSTTVITLAFRLEDV